MTRNRTLEYPAGETTGAECWRCGVVWPSGPDVASDGAGQISRSVTLTQSVAVWIPDVEMVKPLPDAVHVMPVGLDTQVNVPLDVDGP